MVTGSSSATHIALRRLANQHLTKPTITDPAEVVRRLGAVQSQDYAGAKWALAMRCRGATETGIERAFAEGSILRTHVLRPTWHFVTPADIRWMLSLTAPRIKAAMAYYNRKLELDDAVFRRSNATIVGALRDGEHLTRAEIAGALKRARIDVIGSQRLGHLMLRAELDALVCSGARVPSGQGGKQFTYALLDERAPPTPPMAHDEALAELTRRYFATRGPATPNDFAWWSGLTVADAKRGIDMVGGALEREVIDDRAYWSAAESVRAATVRSPTVHLLPNYDEYFIGLKDRSAIGERLKSSALVTGGDALIAYVVAIDGQLVGGWKRSLKKETAIIEFNLLTPLRDAERPALASAVKAYGAFLGISAEARGLKLGRTVSS